MSGFRNADPSLIRAARMFQDNIHTQNKKLKNVTNKNNMLEKELSDLQTKMDAKMYQLQDLQDLAEKTKPAAHILETVMGELEQRNLELSSLLKASENSRLDMETMLKEQNEELTTLRANTLIMRTLEHEINLLTEKKDELQEYVKELELCVSGCKKEEQAFGQRIHDIERDKDQQDEDNAEKIAELTSKLTYAEEQIQEKDDTIERTELTIKDLFEKCSQLGTSNHEIKEELMHCLESGKQLKDLNTKLQFCKDYLEQQVDQLIKELKACKGANEQLKLGMSNINREKQNSVKQVMLLQQQGSQMNGEIQILKDKIGNLQKSIQEYETGDAKSASVIAEISKEKKSHENTKQLLERKIRELESQAILQEGELKNSVLYGRKLKTELMQIQSKTEYYQENFIEKQELQKIKSDLEIKYKLDLNTQLQKVSAVFEQEQNELIAAMRASLNQRNEADTESATSSSMSPFRRSYRTYN